MNETDTMARIPGHLRRVAVDYQRLGQQLLHSSEANPFDAVTQLAVDRIPHAAAASITTLKHDRFVTSAATDDVARRADAIQYALGSGPCVDAIVDQAIYSPRDLASDDRWPEYGHRVQAELGLSSMLSYRMNLEFAGVIAGLNLYGRLPDAFDDHDLAEGLLLTTHAAQAVSAAHLRDRAENLERALSSNRDIGTAVGVLMGQHKLTRDQAFDLLRIASQNTNRKLRDVALDVIDTGDVDVTPHQRR
ncbi:GAF and ANTAR domain-containing protein [Humibacillus xanthopallidus]|uniref:GAF domain-containing protein n=1 Tax=Humibacillus xanthopallidus TaxID=412689 RepID=A0A543HHX5_9MICO|nr:GAF and ANTAR domain-containing protein [Humibacillus xanthopallidus]TQM57928.1 GAF domain-containing protein [Humibacillus xanthopallidus]